MMKEIVLNQSEIIFLGTFIFIIIGIIIGLLMACLDTMRRLHKRFSYVLTRDDITIDRITEKIHYHLSNISNTFNSESNVKSIVISDVILQADIEQYLHNRKTIYDYGDNDIVLSEQDMHDDFVKCVDRKINQYYSDFYIENIIINKNTPDKKFDIIIEYI